MASSKPSETQRCPLEHDDCSGSVNTHASDSVSEQPTKIRPGPEKEADLTCDSSYQAVRATNTDEQPAASAGTSQKVHLNTVPSSNVESSNPRRVHFNLYVQNLHADEAYIIFCDDEKPKALSLTTKTSGGGLWQAAIDIDSPGVSYRYRVFSKGYKIPIPFMSWDRGQVDETEVSLRKVNSLAQFDTFCFKSDSKYYDETVPQSSMFFVTWLVVYVNQFTIKDILMQVKAMRFLSPQKLVEETKSWILKKVSDASVSDFQHLYLAVILGHLAVDNPQCFPLSPDPITKSSVDILLAAFLSCAEFKLLPPSSLKALKKIAPLLVGASSNSSWLSFAVHFYPYFGAQYVLQETMTSQNCEDKEYLKLVDILLRFLAKESDDETREDRSQLLRKALHAAPSRESVLAFYDNTRLKEFFAHSDQDKDKFFIAFYQSDHGHHGSPGEKLVDLLKMPTELRSRIHRTVYLRVLEFLKDVKEPKEEYLEALGKLIMSLSTKMYKDIFAVLMNLSNSKSLPVLDLFLELLDKDDFENIWWLLTLSDKTKVSLAWISSKFREKTSGEHNVQKVQVVFEAVDQLMLCKLNTSKTVLARNLCEEAADMFLRNEDATSVCKAYRSVEKFADIIQVCYKNYVRNLLRQKTNLVRAVILEWQSDSNLAAHHKLPLGPHLSRLGQDLILCALELMDVPEPRDNTCETKELKQMFDWSDVWLVLLSATGCTDKLRKEKKFKDGLKLWQILACNIKSGSISSHLLVAIEKHKERLSSICARVNLTSNASKDEFLHEKKKCLKTISQLLREQKDCSNTFELMKSFLSYGKKLSEHFCTDDEIMHIMLEFNTLEKDWLARKISEIKDERFWGPLGTLLGPAQALKSLIKSTSFTNLAKVCLQESFSHPVEDEEPGKNSLFWLATFLTSKVTKCFESKWKKVFQSPSSLTTKSMKTLLGNLKSENLQEELAMLENYFNEALTSDVKVYVSSYVNFPNVWKQVKNLANLLDTFNLVDSKDSATCTLMSFISINVGGDDLCLEQLNESIIAVHDVLSGFTGEDVEDVVEELGRSKELVAFVKEIVDEDIRFLIDAVDEHSDQFVSESSVSDLIDVHGFLGPLINTGEQSKDAQQFLSTFKNSCVAHKEGMAVKLYQCSTNVNSLRGLYTSVANRGEITKEIIANSLKKGSYSVAVQGNGVEVKMSYQRDDGSDTTYSLTDLLDLRSRAHLIVSSDKNVVKALHSTEKHKDVDFSDFIMQVNFLVEIISLLLKLQFSGYVKYREFWNQFSGTKALHDATNDLQHDLEKWESILSDAREQYYFLNYYRSEQLCVLHDFFTAHSHENCEEVLSLIHFVDPNIKKEHLDVYRNGFPESSETGSADIPYVMISTTGNALDEIFANTTPVIRPIRHDHEQASSHPSTIDASVKSGELFVVSLAEKSQLTANVLLTLYESTSNAFPEPYQVIFCSQQTAWEDIHLLLRRCFAQSRLIKHRSLFCIANVELLTNEVQFRLVNAIKERQNGIHGPESSEKNSDYRLALICRGGDHQHVVEQFAQYSHRMAGMSDMALSDRLKSGWPEVTMITSTLPGLGKTERVRKEVLQKNMNVITFPISGPLDQSKLIQRLKKLKLRKYHCLHLDIGEVSDPLWLDTFLFQLIVTGMVSFGTQLYHLPTNHVYIEVANTLKHWLRESLVILKSFSRVDLKWRNYEDFLVSSEITSDIQVVCQYLDVFDSARLESKDIHFLGFQQAKPLPASRCRELLAVHYSPETVSDITFTALNTFLGVLADQLLKFSSSTFFKIANLKSMLGDDSYGVRTNLFNALLDVSKEFASRAITTCSSALSEKEAAAALDKTVSSSDLSAQDMVERTDSMIQWEDSNHLLVVFHGVNSETIAAVYRNKDLVPNNVKKLLKSQAVRGKNKELEDFKEMTQKQLQEMLEKIACTEPLNACENNMDSSYALTPDNVLKMILIILRVRANAPVIIMGETGCGKTSLVRYLANTCQIPFYYFSFHAGRTEEEVTAFIFEKEREVRKSGKQAWVFMDEINTCDHLGLINDIMCHHTMLGRPLSKNLVFLAACNPYKLRPKEHIMTAGLEGKNVADEYSELVYRVHPLPEAMIDYVWDYGSLAPSDEKVYIRRMVRTLPKTIQGMLVDLLAESQKFLREAEQNNFCVSLRDVYRCIRLIQWFSEMIQKRGEAKKGKDYPDEKHLQAYRLMSEKYNNKPWIKSIVLALAHCYLSRLPTAELRIRYRRRMMMLFSDYGTMMRPDDVDSFSAIVRMEEEDYLNRMELPPGTAKNAALRENVFVMLVCILNRIPVFVVGKPGCSKSLSIQLIRSNLRGRDSKDPLFRELPQLYVVSYQGSESSTSEGIIKVFEKAGKYKSLNEGNVLPVVLLDEVGLAENSKYNPLKVLHSLLEPGDGKLPDVAVVGISNWSLDAAKMNRAIHLSRPKPTIDDLYETGYSLLYADAENKGDGNQSFGKDELRCLAEAYFEYQSSQRHANFHGLRDYYSLIKSLSLSGSGDVQQINMALQRNFGGIPGEFTNIQKIFLGKLSLYIPSSCKAIIPVTKLIQENLADPRARHLMLITSGDSAIGILKQTLTQLKRKTITIFGSRFEEDLSEDYNYRILSRIILCMERDCILILRDLENIYGSLYDMLNQNYAVVGKKKNCRVALGAYSNPMCHVNDNFRCIVLTDHHKVDFSDPPFLNRFEKQLLRFSDVLGDKQQEIIEELLDWVRQLSTIQGLKSLFRISDMFIGFHEDTLPSLVLSHSLDTEEPTEEVLQKCKDDLIWVAAPDGVLRAQKCDLLKLDPQEVWRLTDDFFKKPIHQGFSAFVAVVTSDCGDSYVGSDEIGSKTIVMTFSSIHTDIRKCLGNTVKCQVERLSAYKSEKQLAERVNYFWMTSENELLVLQCKPELDGVHLLLARSIIEEKRGSYEQACKERGVKQRKHACIVVHLQRGRTTDSVPWQFSFLCGWKQVFLDVLEAPPFSLDEIRTKSVQQLLSSSIWPLRNIAQKDLLWCFTCIKYTRHQRPLDSILHIVKSLFSSEKVCGTIERLVFDWVAKNAYQNGDETILSDHWQVKVACDKQALINSSTLYCAMEQFVSRFVREPLAKLIYFLEKENAWPPHVLCPLEDYGPQSELEDLWCKLIEKDGVFNMAEIPKPLGPESYVLDHRNLALRLPFSQVLIGKVDAVKDICLGDHVYEKCCGKLGESDHLTQRVQEPQITHYCQIILNIVPEIGELPASCLDSYMLDLFDVMTTKFSTKLQCFQRVSVVKAMFFSIVKPCFQVKRSGHSYAQLHVFSWTFREQILNQLRMVECCQPFIDPQVLTHLTDEYLSSQNMLSYPSSNNDEIHEEIEIEREMASREGSKEGQDDRRPLNRKLEDGHYLPNISAPVSSESAATEFLRESDEGIVRNDWSEDSFTEDKLMQGKRIESEDDGDNTAFQDCEVLDYPVESNVETTFRNFELDNLEVGEKCETLTDESTESFKDAEGQYGGSIAFHDREAPDYTEKINLEMTFGNFESDNLAAAEQCDKLTDESPESSEDGEEQEGWEDHLVTVYCEQMLPCKETVENRNGGLCSWLRNANLLLSLAYTICNQTPAFHFLRLCVDLATVVSTSGATKRHCNLLYTLNELGEYLKPYGYLDSDDSFDVITEKVIKDLEKQDKAETVDYEVLQKFAALFYGRCLDTNVDTGSARSIVEQVLSLDRADLVVFMGPVIMRLLLAEENDHPDVFVDLISKPSLIKNCACLQTIDEVLKEFLSAGSIHHDSYPAVLICDLIQSLLKLDRHSIQDIDSLDCNLFESTNAAVRVLSFGERDNYGLVILSAVAFLRAFLTMLSRFIAGKGRTLKPSGSYAQVMMKINSLLKVSHPRSLSLRVFFLKQLNQNMSLFDLCKLCRESDMLPAFRDVWNNYNVGDKAQFSSVSKLPEYEKVKAAYWKLTNGNDSEMLTFLRLCQSSPNHRLAILGILVNMIYLKRAVKKLTDNQERLAEWFSEQASILPTPMKEILLRIIGHKDFQCSQLHISPESSVDEVETALLVLHITCVIASGVKNESSPMYQYFSDPLKSKKTVILAHGKDRIHRVFEKHRPERGLLPFTCSCGVRIIVKQDHEDNRCPLCGECADFDLEQINDSAVGTTTICARSSSLVTNEKPHWDDCTSEMIPSVYRALHLLVYATLYAGVATELSSKEDLSSLLSGLGLNQCPSETKDPAQVCFDHVKNDLSCLMTILSCKKDVAVKAMHLVVEKCTELIRGKKLCKDNTLTQKEYLHWEVEFSNLTEGVLLETLGSSNRVKKRMALPDNIENESTSPLQDQILEFDGYPTDSDQQDQQLKRLFRLTRQPTFKDFRAIFVNSPKYFQSEHSLLSLFFAWFDQLPNINNLYPLLNWSRLVSEVLTHRISRKDALWKTINDFITGHLQLDKTTAEIEKHRNLFNSFKEAWDNIRPLVNQQLSSEVEEMPRLTEMDCIAYCLTESDRGIYLLTAIKILVSLQNSILDEMVVVSTLRQHPALTFLQKNDKCSGIASVSLKEAKEREIINFLWSDDLLKYAQNNPEYGKGEEIIYNFARIETELAKKLAFGKCYLTGTLTKFVFSKELFHSCGPLLTEIRELFNQSANLPDDVTQGLLSLRDRRMKEAQDLLQHIEILIFLLKRELKGLNVDMTLESFAESWLVMLPTPFPVTLLPQPRKSIKLKHVAALYEALEDMLADGAIEGLPDQFRTDLSDDMKDNLSYLVNRESGQLELRSFLTALRRFVFRYLSSEKYLPEEMSALSCCLKEPSLWLRCEIPDLEVIPKEMTLKNIHAIVTRLQELEKERKGNARSSGVPTFHRSAQVAPSSKQHGRKKRRIVTNFSFS